MKQGFIVGRIDDGWVDVEKKLIMLAGRACNDLRLGDILISIDKFEYIIKRIIIYKREFDIVDSGWTCLLELNGHIGDIKINDILYIKNKE